MPAPENQNQQENANAPALSVVLVVGGQRDRAGRALRSLLEQNIIDRMEILLFDLGPENCPALAGSDHPRVRFSRRTPKDLLSIARADGVRGAKAPVVCFMEEHCEMQPGSAEAILLAHRGHWAGVGSDFINGNPDAKRSNQAFRMNYGAYVGPTRLRGPIPRVAGQNSAFKRDVLLRYEPLLESMMNADLVLQARMQQDGYELLYEPNVKFAHRNENTFFSLVTGVFFWNWCFSNVRARAFNWGILRRTRLIVLSPLIPWVRLVRVFSWTLPRPGSAMLQFLRDIPFALAINYCSAAGQVAGLFGSLDRAAREFSHFEMNEPRLLREELTR